MHYLALLDITNLWIEYIKTPKHRIVLMRFSHELVLGVELGPRSIFDMVSLQTYRFLLCFSFLGIRVMLSTLQLSRRTGGVKFYFHWGNGDGLLILSYAILSLWSSYSVELDPMSVSSQLSLYPLLSESELFTYYFCYCFNFKESASWRSIFCWIGLVCVSVSIFMLHPFSFLFGRSKYMN